MKNRFLLLIFSTLTFSGISQTYNMSNTTVNTCSGTFYDPGGTGNYSNSTPLTTMTFCSTGGNEIILDFTGLPFQVETGFDFLNIYDGVGTGGSLLWNSQTSGGTTNPGIIMSTTGCLTITFSSDGSVTYSGWQATISCYTPSCTDGIMNGGETGIDCGGPNCVPCPDCNNGIQDGNETGVDCGGTMCAPCPTPCDVGITNVQVGPAISCNGGTVQLTANGVGSSSYVLYNDFNSGSAGAGWSSTGGASFGEPCGANPTGTPYYWASTSTGTPQLSTVPFDVSCGGVINFDMAYATQGGASPCEGPDLPNEGVTLQYSTDGGVTWTVMSYWDPNGGYDPMLTSWNSYSFPIPAAAMTPNTEFQWIQNNSSGTCCDNWGIDNVSITSVTNCAPYWYDWAQVAGAPDSAVQVESLTTTTTYTVTYTNGTDGCSDSITITVPPGTNIDAGPDQIYCVGAPAVTIGANPVSPDNGATYGWSTGAAGTISSSVNGQIAVTPPVTTDYFLQVTLNGCTMYDTVQVLVSNLVVTGTAVTPSCQVLSDGGIHIDSPGASEYSFDNGTTWQVDSFDLSLPAGTYDVCARTPLGCTECVQVIVVDPTPVTISVSNDVVICQNGTGNLSATATGGTSYNFHWGMTTDLNPAQTVNPISTAYYTVYAENQNGCISPLDSILVTVLPPISGTISPFDTVCPTYSTDIFATANGGIGQPYTFTWSTGDTYTGVPNHQTNVIPTQTTTYTVTITDGCESTPLVLTTDMRVAPLPVPTYLVTNPIQCEPAEFEIINTTDPTMSEFIYWEVDGLPYINQDTILSQELMAGNYDVFMMVTSYEGCVDSTLFPNTLHVDPKPDALFHFSPDPVTMFNTDVTFLNYSYNGDTYQWFFPGGTPAASTQEDVQVRYPDGVVDSYDVTLITTSALGCVDTLVKTIIVNPEVILYAPNTFTPDGDEFNQSWNIHIEGVDIYNFELFIFNRWGEVIWESHDPSVGWDGTYKGKIVQQGTYTWIIRVNDILNDDKHTFNGFVNVMR